MRLLSAQQHEYALLRPLKIYRKPPKYGHLYNTDTQRGPHGVHIREVSMYIQSIFGTAINYTSVDYLTMYRHIFKLILASYKQTDLLLVLSPSQDC